MTTMPRKEALASLKSQLRSQDPEFLACRDMRHAWFMVNDYFVAEDDNRIIRELECTRCHTFRRDSFRATRDGRLIRFGTSYTYPDGYQMKNVLRGVKPQELVRGEVYRRSMAKHVQERIREKAS